MNGTIDIDGSVYPRIAYREAPVLKTVRTDWSAKQPELFEG